MRFGKKMENFFEKFSVPTTYWRLIPGLAENFEIFLSSLSTGREKCVWPPIFDFSSLYFSLKMDGAFLANTSYFYMELLPLSLT